MYFITTKRMLEVCFSAHPNIQYRTTFYYYLRLHLIALTFISKCKVPKIMKSPILHLYKSGEWGFSM